MIDLQLILQLLVIGLALGSLYALVALGYTMVYGIIELINFAHGDIFMIGSMVAITVLNTMGIAGRMELPLGTLILALVLSCLVAMIACALIGVIIERLAYRPLRNAPRLAPLISAIGVSLILQDAGKLWKGEQSVPFPYILPTQPLTIGPFSIPIPYLISIVAAVLLMVALNFLVNNTKMGRAMRSVAQDREAAALMGVNVDRVISVTFFIGAGLAGAAGFMYAMCLGKTEFTAGFTMGLIAFTAAVLGGVGNITGAMLGGIALGVAEQMVQLVPDWILPLGGAAWSKAMIFAILILVLVFRPTGLLGKPTVDKV